MPLVGDGAGKLAAAALNGTVSVSDTWQMPPSSAFGKIYASGFFEWESGGATSQTMAVLTARRRLSDGSDEDVVLTGGGADTDIFDAPHFFGDEQLTEITFGMQVRAGIAWAVDQITWFG